MIARSSLLARLGRAIGALSVSGLASLTLANGASADVFAIVGGKVVTNTELGIIEDGTVVMVDGRITYVGPAPIAIYPSGAKVLDAGGLWVTPGLFTPYSELGLVEVSAEDSTDDTGAPLAAFSVALDAADGFNPAASPIAINRLDGVTRAAVAASPTGSLFAGRGALVSLSGEPDSVFGRRAFLSAAFGESGAALAGGARTASWAYFRAAVEDAKAYPNRYADGGEGDALTRLDAEAFGPYTRGAGPILVALDRASDVLALIDFASANPAMRFIIVGGAEAHLVANELADAKIPVILDPVRNLPSSFSMIGASLDAPRLLDEAGVVYAFAPLSANGGETHNVRAIAQSAGNAVAHGLDWDRAFAAISLTPAQLYGLEDELGALAPGLRGDVVLWDGDPLEVMSNTVAVFIDGEETAHESRQSALRDRYLSLTRSNGLPTSYPRP